MYSNALAILYINMVMPIKLLWIDLNWIDRERDWKKETKENEKRKRLRERKRGRRPERWMRRRRSGHERQGRGSLASPPGHHDGVLPPQQTARLTQQMELMMRNKRDHFTVVLGKPQRLLGHLSDRASQSPGVRYGQLFEKCSPE